MKMIYVVVYCHVNRDHGGYSMDTDVRKVFDSKRKAVEYIVDTFNGYSYRDGEFDGWYRDGDLFGDCVIIEEWEVE